MNPEHWQQVKDLFHAALEREPSGRSVFLDQACSGDQKLRSEVESLIDSFEKTGDFIDVPAYELAADLLTEQKSAMNPGQLVASYRLISLLGRGGMGEVYLAEDVRLGRKVALKFLPASYSNDSERLRRFEREARAASALNHPNILTVHEVGQFDGRQFIATEFVEGETLRQRQLTRPLKLDEVLELAVQVTAALAAAHQAGIVHRDIKPENIMLRNDGYAKVVDFGLAKLTETARVISDTSAPTMLQTDTGTGVVMGTTAYMSPEQARGLQLDARTDIWSLGVVLYELLSGTMPFKGDTPSDLIVSILERDPSPILSTRLVPSELDWIVRKALRKDREERYQTARELLGDLRNVKKQLEFNAQLERSAVPDSVSAAPATNAAETQFLPGRALSTDEPRPAPTGGVTTEHLSQALPARGKSVRMLALIGILLVLGVTAILSYKWLTSRPASFSTMRITRLTNSGKAIDAALSPDGKYLVYTLSDAGKQSLWIRQVSSANDKEIVPAAPVGFFGATFSPDGNDLYYAIKSNLDAGTLYRIPAFGGTPVKILERIDGPVSFSPDAKQFVLVRANYPNLGESAVLISNIDGTAERILAVRKAPESFAPIFFTGPAWSPDGKLIAATVSKAGVGSQILTISISDGVETSLTNEPWNFAGRVAWLPDMTGLLVIAGDSPGAAQIWQLLYPSGEKRPVTNDLSVYRSLSLASDGQRFSTIQSSGLVNIFIAPDGDAQKANQLPTGNVGFFTSTGNSVSWSPDGRIVFVSNESGMLDVWIMNADGTNRRQLTANARYNTNPAVSPDGKLIVFSSNRTGKRQIWRMDIDGANPRRLTDGVTDAAPAISADGQWVFYSSLFAGKPTLWKVNINGGESAQVTDRVAVAPSISPDGKLIAYLYPEAPDPLVPPNRIGVMTLTGELVKTFSFQPSGTITPYVHWSHDGQSLIYNVSINNVTNLWSQPFAGGPPKQITFFRDSLMTGFSFTADGKTLACTRGLLLRDAVLISEDR